MNTKILPLTAAVVLTASWARAQTNFPEIEPNDSKTGAQAINCMANGDTITGTSTGALTTAGATSADNFRVKTCTATPGVYLHVLTITGASNTNSLRGVSQTNGVIATTADVALTTPTAALGVRWYGFGQGEEIYYRVTGAAASTAGYVSTLTNTTVAPTAIPGVFAPGASFTITSLGQGHTSDTEIYVFDSSYNMVGHNDDIAGGSIAGPSTISGLVLAAGTYTVAISNWNTCNNLSDLNAGEAYDDGNLLDFPNGVANSSTTTAVNCAFSVSDGTTTSPMATTKVAAYDVNWFTFQVGSPAVFQSFCAGDGSLTDHTTPCPCGNNGAPGNGCGHSFDPNGANMSATGTAAADDVVLHSQFEPASSFTLMMQHGNSGDAVFHDGVLCAGNPLIRLRGRSAVGGEAFFPNSNFAQDSTTTLSARGGTFPGSGATMRYAAWYRNASTTFCPPATANVTNGWLIVW